MLSGCASQFGTRSPAREPVTRSLPPSPSYLKTSAVPVAREGGDALVLAKQRGEVIKRQNKVIVGAKNLWEKTRKTYSESQLKRKLFGQ